MGKDRKIMNHDEIKAIAQATTKNIKTEADLNDFRQMLTKITVETALNAELDDHLGYSRHELSEKTTAAMALQARPYRPKTVNLKSTPRVIVLGALSLSSLRNINADSPQWMTKFSFFTPKG